MNKPFANQVLQYLLDHPEEHDQRYYARRTPCGTTFCVAGTACLLAGLEIKWVELSSSLEEFGANCLNDNRNINAAAQGLLGLSDDEADYLFMCTLEIEDITDFIRSGELPSWYISDDD